MAELFNKEAQEAITGTNENADALTNTIKLDDLGPIIVNTDGTLARIPNWETLTEGERAKTFKLIARRNKQRMMVIKESSGMPSMSDAFQSTNTTFKEEEEEEEQTEVLAIENSEKSDLELIVNDDNCISETEIITL